MRKKDKKAEPKQKEFSSAPFKTLKGVQVQAPATPEKTEPPRPKPVQESASDDVLFLREMANVHPVDGRRKKPAAPKAGAPAVAAKIDEEERGVFLNALETMQLDVRFEDDLPDEADPLKPLSVNRLRQLKRGEISIDLELDLHGLTREQALQSLDQFIKGAYNREQKAVLVITGKGNNSPDEPVLLRAVAGWLRDKGRSRVAEFSPAPRHMGGAGAFVVFLREKEKSAPATAG